MSSDFNPVHREWSQAAVRAQRNGQSAQRQEQAAFEAALRKHDAPPRDAAPPAPAKSQPATTRPGDDTPTQSPPPQAPHPQEDSPMATAFHFQSPATSATRMDLSACINAMASRSQAPEAAAPTEPAPRGRIATSHAIDTTRVHAPVADAANSIWQLDTAGQQLPMDSLRVERTQGGDMRVALHAADAPSAEALQRLRQRLASRGGELVAWEGEAP